MKIRFIVIFLIGCSSTDELKFNIEANFDEKKYQELREDYNMYEDSVMYEDDNYFVIGSCSGEWGGSIRFVNKSDSVSYTCEAACPVSIYFLNGNYYLTSTLAHGMVHSRVFKIENPQSMEKYALPEPQLMEDGSYGFYIGDTESASTLGRTTILDTTRLLILSAFIYENDIFHITTDFKNTFLSRVIEGQFEHIDTVLNFGVESYQPMIVQTNDGRLLSFFSNNEVRGFLNVQGNKIEAVMTTANKR